MGNCAGLDLGYDFTFGCINKYYVSVLLKILSSLGGPAGEFSLLVTSAPKEDINSWREPRIFQGNNYQKGRKVRLLEKIHAENFSNTENSIICSREVKSKSFDRFDY